MGKSNSEIRALCVALREQGFTVELLKNGRYQAISPSGRKAQFSAHPNDRRNILNAISRLKKVGYVPAT